jgi:hypothetical protein
VEPTPRKESIAMGMAEDIQAQIDSVAKNAERVSENKGVFTPPAAIEPKEIDDLENKGKKLVVDAHSGIHINPDSEKPIGQGGLGPRKHPPNFSKKDSFAGGSGESHLESK